MGNIAALGLLLILTYLLIVRVGWSNALGLSLLSAIFVITIYLVINNWDFISSNSRNLTGLILLGPLALLLMARLSLSPRARSQLKVRLAKTFSLYKYDYRESWLGFNSALDVPHQEQNFYSQTIKALAEMVGSSGGKLWSRNADRFSFVDHWNSPLLREQSFSLPAELIRFVERHNWVIDINEYIKDPKTYQGLVLDSGQFEEGAIKIFIPLRRETELVAIVGLKSLDATQNLNWEDHDLLKAAGQQMASYLGLYEATSRLYEQREFAAFNRLSTFVVHDLKNVSAQLELITQNAHKFGTNPEFIQDSFQTVESANNRINKMLTQLRRKDSINKGVARSYLPDLVEKLRARLPSLNISGEIPNIHVLGAEEQLLNIVLHLDENAHEAVDAKAEEITNGVLHKIEQNENDVYWHIIDQGVGMSEEYVRDKLFKPFETTKGGAGMGIGVYQCRYLLRSNDGDLIIRSRLGEGTHCTAILSLVVGATSEEKGDEDGSR